MIAVIFNVVYTHSEYINGLVQDCGISIANVLEMPQSSTKLWLYIPKELCHVPLRCWHDPVRYEMLYKQGVAHDQIKYALCE